MNNGGDVLVGIIIVRGVDLMPDVFHGPCSLCSRTASYELVDAGKRKWFRCDACKNFIIAELAEKKVASSPELRRHISLKSAALREDMVLHIFVPESSLGDQGAQKALRAVPELKSTWLQRST